jgi:predicted nucleic acid-binding protein
VIVLDASVVLALLLPLPHSSQAAAAFRRLKEAREELYAPALLEYEVCSVLRRSRNRGVITDAEVDAALSLLPRLAIVPVTPASSLHARALHWSERLQQAKAYDAQYLALAEQMHCPLLTADLRLAHAARDLGLDWVKGVQQTPA